MCGYANSFRDRNRHSSNFSIHDADARDAASHFVTFEDLAEFHLVPRLLQGVQCLLRLSMLITWMVRSLWSIFPMAPRLLTPPRNWPHFVRGAAPGRLSRKSEPAAPGPAAGLFYAAGSCAAGFCAAGGGRALSRLVRKPGFARGGHALRLRGGGHTKSRQLFRQCDADELIQ